MEKTPFERFVAQALLETNALEWSPVLEGTGAEPAYSPRYRAWERRLLKNPFAYAKTQSRTTWQRALRAAACVVLAVSVAFGGLIAVNPTARAWVQQIIAEWFGDHARFSFSVAAGLETGAWRTGYLPDGFELVRETEIGPIQKNTYQNKHNVEIQLQYVPGDVGSFGVDSAHQAYEEVPINGTPGYLLRSASPDVPSFLVWAEENGSTAFKLTSQVSPEELIKIAQSMVPQ